jgi:hypothetical protein
VASEGENAAREAPEVNDDTVEALLDNVRHFLKDLDDLGTSLHARGSTLVSFGGIIITIVAFLHRDQASSFDLWAWSALPAGLALVFLLFAVVIVVWFVLIPTKGITIGHSEIAKYPTYEFVSQSKVAVQGRTLRGLVVAHEVERKSNRRKARGLRVAFIALLLGLIFVTLDIGVLTTEDRNDGGTRGERYSCSHRGPGHHSHATRSARDSCP